MIFGQVWEQFAEDGSGQPGERLYESAPFADFHDAEPQGEDAGQSDGDFKPRFGRGKRRVDDVCKHGRISAEDEFAQCHGKGNQEKGNPNVIQHHD